ncbi:hypothetical protein DUNSADRAFT_12635 [Dunaliella salina]|uniref:Uncharacterized protein n=1 Tax=Dunaliella salina TaxID=3046 RepID=A0ABQ7H3M1_DUNSA|nr:hypothetical protein DUNSADRAFT_12635 [Dunaliella salina]|eukprot:KAF5841470.1 hypothetical protein DUNSADRAFT_12635 [Dunaliella salina]
MISCWASLFLFYKSPGTGNPNPDAGQSLPFDCAEQTRNANKQLQAARCTVLSHLLSIPKLKQAHYRGHTAHIHKHLCHLCAHSQTLCHLCAHSQASVPLCTHSEAICTACAHIHRHLCCLCTHSQASVLPVHIFTGVCAACAHFHRHLCYLCTRSQELVLPVPARMQYPSTASSLKWISRVGQHLVKKMTDHLLRFLGGGDAQRLATSGKAAKERTYLSIKIEMSDLSEKILPVNQALSIFLKLAQRTSIVFFTTKTMAPIVLDVSFTAVGNALIEALCYRLRIEAWCTAQGEPPPPGTNRWHRCRIQHWQLAGTRVSEEGVSVLTLMDRLTLLDVRRCGVPRAALAALERRFPLLRLVQGSVLSESVSLAANVINSEAFACACGHDEGKCAASAGPDSTPCKFPSKALGGSAHVGGYGGKMDAWVLEGISRLLAASQKLIELAQQVQEPSRPPLPLYPLMPPMAQWQHYFWLHHQSVCQPHQFALSPYQEHAYPSLYK